MMNINAMEITHHQRKRRSKNLIGIAVLSACLLYIASSLLEPSIDFDHDVPDHRFMPQTYGRRSLADTEGPSEEEAPQEVEGSLRKFPLQPREVVLKKRSEEDAKAVRKRAVRAASARAAKLDGGEGSSLDPEVAKSVLATAASAEAVDTPPRRMHNVTAYDIDAALLAAHAFHRELLFFVYDSATDDFVVVHNNPTCEWGCKRAYIVAPVLAYALRKNYPQRFKGGESGDLVFLLSVGDVPRVRRPCLFEESKYCKSDKWAPILQFGSVLVDPIYMPTAIAMPQSPRPFIPCFDEFQTTGNVCQDLQPRVMNAASNAAVVDGSHDLKTGVHFQHGLVFGKELGLLEKATYWDDLIPQVVWRGTDFMFLHTLFPDMRAPTYEEDIKKVEGKFGKDVSRGAIKALWDMGEDKLTPRWRGVLLTTEAELEAKEHEALRGEASLPWVNIKFASYNVNGQKVPASENPEFQLLQEKFGIAAIGQSMNMMEHARYKYHIDPTRLSRAIAMPFNFNFKTYLELNHPQRSPAR